MSENLTMILIVILSENENGYAELTTTTNKESHLQYIFFWGGGIYLFNVFDHSFIHERMNVYEHMEQPRIIFKLPVLLTHVT